MIDYKSYWFNGMGLHEIQLKYLEKIIKENNIKNIIEFGSGGSTKFFCDLREKENLKYKIISFDHNEQYSYNKKHPFLSLHIRDLIKCSDEDFNLMFSEKEYNRNKFINCQTEKDNFRVKNAFYDLQKNDISCDKVDLVILDGPNGNGRSLSFLHLKDKILENCFILIDDSDHYDFIEKCKEVFDCEIIVHGKHPEIHPLFNYAILKVKKK